MLSMVHVIYQVLILSTCIILLKHTFNASVPNIRGIYESNIICLPNGISGQHCFLQFRIFWEKLLRKSALIRLFSFGETTKNEVIKH